MIYNLRKKFIIISAVAVSVVFALIFGMIYIASTSQLNHTMDMLTNVISKKAQSHFLCDAGFRS